MVINIAHTAFDTPLLFTAAAKIEFLRYIAHTLGVFPSRRKKGDIFFSLDN